MAFTQIAFFAAAGLCALSLAISGLFWVAARSKGTDWTSPVTDKLKQQSLIALAIALFTGICAFALYGWTYLYL